MNTSILSRIVGRTTSETAIDQEPAPQSSLPPFVGVLLKQFGITPEAINTYAEGLRNSVVGALTEISTRLTTIENKLNELESNQRILLDAATKDGEHDAFLATLECLEIPSVRRGEPCEHCGKSFCTEHSVVITESNTKMN